MQMAPEEHFSNLMEVGYEFLEEQDSLAACKAWVEAWQLAKNMARPEMRTRKAFVKAYPKLKVVFENWAYDFMFELHNAGLHDPRFNEYRLQFIREFLIQFPDEDEDIILNFGRGQGEALWELGKYSESDAVYTTLVERLPDEAWAYIGWADNYWLTQVSPKQYDRAEAILQQGLNRPNLKDRDDLLDRLAELYDGWGKPEKSKALRQEQKKTNRAAPQSPAFLHPPAAQSEQKGKKRATRGRRKKKS